MLSFDVNPEAKPIPTVGVQGLILHDVLPTLEVSCKLNVEQSQKLSGSCKLVVSIKEIYIAFFFLSAKLLMKQSGLRSRPTFGWAAPAPDQNFGGSGSGSGPSHILSG